MSTGNKNIVLVMGKPNSGKSTSVRNLHNQDKMVYLNTDLKELPFKSNFAAVAEVANAMDIFSYLDQIEQTPQIEGAVLDTITFLMSMYERQFVVPAADSRAAWGDYGNFYRDFIHAIKSGTKDYAILAHEDSFLNEQTMQMESRVPVKGSVGRTGVEADFTTILSTKELSIKQLEGHENDLLTITDQEREDGVKRVFCTRITEAYRGEKMRSAMDLWGRNELFIDNDLDLVFKRLREYYGS